MAKFRVGSGGMGRPNKKTISFKKKPGNVKTVAGKKDDKQKNDPVPQPVNPFEVKINKQKFQILGRPTKHERGLPGVSRSKALRKRKETLLQEYKVKHKTNKFVDKRLGEKDPSMTVEAKMELRFLTEKNKNSNKKSKFILGDDEVLTHRGQTLADVERFDDPRSDDDEDEERLGNAFVSEAHFGGGFLKKSEDTEENRQNRESLIDNLIAESKKRKEERQKEREETDELTDKLDEDYKSMLDVLATIRNPPKKEAVPVSLPDSAYDVLVRELRFDPRVKPGNKLKSAEEIAREEREKLEKLEADRLRRMKGDLTTTKVIPHRSADDLDDGFSYIIEPQVKALSFGSDGKISNVDNEETKEESEESEGEADDENNEDEEDEDGDEDSFSDLNSNDESEGEENEVSEVRAKSKKDSQNSSIEAKKDKGAADNMRTDIPFVFKVPKGYDDFLQLIENYNSDDHKTVLERMIQSNHPALDGANKPKIEKIFTFLLQYIHDTALSADLTLLNELAPVAFNLSQIVPANHVATIMLDVLLEKREELSVAKKRRAVSLATIIFLKLTSLIFPTSDFRHLVTTPSFHLLLEALSLPVTSLQSVHSGLMLCTIALEFVSFSQRYIPEVVHFLRGLLDLAVPRPDNVPAPNLVYPFRPVGQESQLLVLAEKDTKLSTCERLKLNQVEFDDNFRVGALYITVRLLSDFLSIWNGLPASHEIYSPVLESLRKLPSDRYDDKLKEAIKKLTDQIELLSSKTRKRLVHETKKPKPLRLYEPAFEERFDGKKKRVGSKEKQERDKMQHKLKREMKGAIREIRKDNAFIARQQLQEQIEKDAERKRKVKDLLSSLATQEGEIRKLKKAKK